MSVYPTISVLTPTYNRGKFLPLFIHNLKNQSYPHNKIEVCIYDDGTEPFGIYEEIQEQLKPMKVIYRRDKVKKSIGEKRNFLVKKIATNRLYIFMDDDDIYLNDYIRYSVDTLINTKSGLVGSNGMIFCYPHKDFKMTGIKCRHLAQIHEATMCFTRKYFNSMGGFEKSSRGEGAKFIQNRENGVSETNIEYLMVCVAHDGNTIDKEQFDNDKTDIQETYKGSHVAILKQILNIK